jgi:hypothetical protein
VYMDADAEEKQLDPTRSAMPLFGGMNPSGLFARGVPLGAVVSYCPGGHDPTVLMELYSKTTAEESGKDASWWMRFWRDSRFFPTE